MTRRSASALRWDEQISTKRLVAHVEADPHDQAALRSGPRDGEPVAVPTPCLRLMAGYWCPCGSGFLGLRGQEHVRTARVEALGNEQPTEYTGDPDGLAGRDTLWPTRSDRLDLQEQIEQLPIGTIVERHGTGIAVAFDRGPVESGRPATPSYPF